MFKSFQVNVPLDDTQLVGLSNAGGCAGPVWGAVTARCLLRNASYEYPCERSFLRHTELLAHFAF
eukprot:1152698-Pelagomonas_calceolata.AAC.9